MSDLLDHMMRELNDAQAKCRVAAQRLGEAIDNHRPQSPFVAAHDAAACEVLRIEERVATLLFAERGGKGII